MTRKRLTPSQIAAHVAECDGCSICHGEPPPRTKLEERQLPVLIGEMFTRPGEPYSPAMRLLLELAAEEKAARQAAAKPGEMRKAERATREALEQFRANHIAVYKHERGWVKAACNFYDIDRKTLYNRMKTE